MPIAAVSYLNTVPLIEGIAKLDRVRLHLTVPADLINLLEDQTVAVALASSIDYQRSHTELALLPSGVIASDGETLTVRAFSRVPIDQVESVHTDNESHTSVALLRVLMHALHARDVRVTPFRVPHEHATVDDWPETVLLIGDKVVTGAPPAALYPYQLDLGDAWKRMTGLPFVYAAWMVRVASLTENPAGIAMATTLLQRQRLHNRTRLGVLARTHAPRHGWPSDVAERYLTKHLSFDVTERHVAGLTRFYELASEFGVIDGLTPIRWVNPRDLQW